MTNYRAGDTVNVTKPTPAECVAMGGHCWPEQEGFFITNAELIRVCRHCNLTQRGVRQEPVRWEEVV